MAALLLGMQIASSAASQELMLENPNRVKAAFLRNFAHYVTWPDEGHATWRICILGKDPFEELLEKTVAGKTEQGKPFEVFRAETLEGLPECQIVYVAYNDAIRRKAALAVLRSRSVLTVGEGLDFLRDGGIIRFHVGERVQMSVNLDQARSASLVVQTKMLEVAKEVQENGTLREMR